ncbi:hypothetical protein BST61_g1637 [Cercospora zeina]
MRATKANIQNDSVSDKAQPVKTIKRGDRDQALHLFGPEEEQALEDKSCGDRLGPVFGRYWHNVKATSYLKLAIASYLAMGIIAYPW